MTDPTQTIYGIKASLALFQRRPKDIQRIFYRLEQARSLGDLLSWAAGERIPYRQLDEEGMRKVAKSTHHEGLALATRPLRYQSFLAVAEKKPARWLALDQVENPHNLGAIFRTAAFFGLGGVVVSGTKPLDKVNSAAIRVAEGGAETLKLCAAPLLDRQLKLMQGEGWRVIGLETGSEPLPDKGAFRPPWILVAGNEAEGLSPQVRRACTDIHSIPGSGKVGSLNVSVAVGVALASLADI